MIHEFLSPDNQRVDTNGDGRSDYKGYFNRWGTLVRGCTTAGLDCIPYEYNNVIMNFYGNKEARYAHSPCDTCAKVDMDISKRGQRWITWFYRYAGGHNNTPTPAPTARPTTPPPPTPNGPTATPMPTNTPVPTGTTQQIVAQIRSGGDDVSEVAGSLDITSTDFWIGDGNSTTASFTGLRFTNINIPRSARITSAHLEVYSNRSQWIPLNLQIAAEAADNSSAFSATSRPSQRLLTASVSHSSNVNWSANSWYSLNEMATVIQQVVNRSGWKSGNSLSIILKGTSNKVWVRKFINSFEVSPGTAVRLVITYTP
jgi:hypothetical protein